MALKNFKFLYEFFTTLDWFQGLSTPTINVCCLQKKSFYSRRKYKIVPHYKIEIIGGKIVQSEQIKMKR